MKNKVKFFQHIKKSQVILIIAFAFLWTIQCTLIFSGCRKKQTAGSDVVSETKPKDYGKEAQLNRANSIDGSQLAMENETADRLAGGQTILTNSGTGRLPAVTGDFRQDRPLESGQTRSPSGDFRRDRPLESGQTVSRSQSESLSSASLSSIRSGRGVFIGELNPVNYKTVDPAVLLQMGMEQYQVSFIMGERYFNDRNFDKALAEYNKAISLKPDYAEAFFSRGRVFQLRGDLNRALDDFNKTIALKKDSAAAYNYRGYIFAQRGEHAKALSDYNQALALKKDYCDALYNRGYCYRVQGQYDRAIEDFNRLIQLEPNNASAYNQRGTAWYYKENDERAIRDFSEAIKIKPDYALAWHNRGTAYRMSGNITLANADFAQASKLGYK